jgi:nucleotide-sensitive chloride channel 1A
MQLITFAPDSEEDAEPDSVSVTLIPTASAPATTLHTDAPTEGLGATSEDPIATEGEPEQTPVVALFTALSDCSNLHPDPVQEGEEEGESRLMQAGLIMPGDSHGGLPPAMPGSGGWITAENMHEFFDEGGNYIGPEDDEGAAAEDLGPGAGTVRARDEEMETDDAKWQRTG